jgi:hypothetical protein
MAMPDLDQVVLKIRDAISRNAMFYEEFPEDTKQYQVSAETIEILSWVATNIALPTILAILVAPVSETFASRIDGKDKELRKDIETLKKDVAELLERARSQPEKAFLPNDCPKAVDQVQERLEYHGWPAADANKDAEETVRLLIEWVRTQLDGTE